MEGPAPVRYRTTNWRIYNEALKRRGSLLIWLDRDMVRLWTDDEKRSICFQTTAPGVSVAQVARRYAVNANLIFKWLRD
ncbi:transposase, partial [Paenirhodobacter populi]|uniref:transposase n=1 Tax=Paenirhodobacter populi TaxID=2306993 RepID=UPI001F4FA3A6